MQTGFIFTFILYSIFCVSTTLYSVYSTLKILQDDDIYKQTRWMLYWSVYGFSFAISTFLGRRSLEVFTFFQIISFPPFFGRKVSHLLLYYGTKPLLFIADMLRPYMFQLYVLINSFFLKRLDELIPDYFNSAEDVEFGLDYIPRCISIVKKKIVIGPPAYEYIN